jgi:hypothetical protein
MIIIIALIIDLLLINLKNTEWLVCLYCLPVLLVYFWIWVASRKLFRVHSMELVFNIATNLSFGLIFLLVYLLVFNFALSDEYIKSYDCKILQSNSTLLKGRAFNENYQILTLAIKKSSSSNYEYACGCASD